MGWLQRGLLPTTLPQIGTPRGSARVVAAQESAVRDRDAAIDDDVGDDLLRLVFTACHPILTVDARVALTLRLLGGLTTKEIARAFLVAEPTIAQRIVRAKRTRPALCDDALRLGRTLVAIAPDEPEVHGLLGLMELTASRSAARTGPSGEPVRLADQDRSRWDRLLIGRGLEALRRAGTSGPPRGRYTLQAAIGACHARAPSTTDTDWHRIADLHAELGRIAPSPVVELNRAVAVGMASGAAAGLAIVDALAAERSLRRYHLLPGARGEFLEKLGRFEEARAEFQRAASLTRNVRERDLLLERGEACARSALGAHEAVDPPTPRR
jgi:predicted RNA polymerase sigma factor